MHPQTLLQEVVAANQHRQSEHSALLRPRRSGAQLRGADGVPRLLWASREVGISQKGSPERCGFRFIPLVSVFFRFLPFSTLFYPFPFLFLFGCFFRVPIFFRFFRFSFFSVFFRFFRFLPFHFPKKTGRHRSRHPFCETPTKTRLN